VVQTAHRRRLRKYPTGAAIHVSDAPPPHLDLIARR
jgi:hypothetical protein